MTKVVKKVRSLLALLQAGSVVADPALWKKRQITVSVLVSLIWAALSLGGLDDRIGAETVDAVAVGLLALVNGVLTLTTSDKIGVQPRRQAPKEGGGR